MPTKKPRISITLEPETYRQISNMAKKENKDLSVIGRELIEDALNAEVCQENLDFLSTIIREQLSAIMHFIHGTRFTLVIKNMYASRNCCISLCRNIKPVCSRWEATGFCSGI